MSFHSQFPSSRFWLMTKSIRIARCKILIENKRHKNWNETQIVAIAKFSLRVFCDPAKVKKIHDKLKIEKLGNTTYINTTHLQKHYNIASHSRRTVFFYSNKHCNHFRRLSIQLNNIQLDWCYRHWQLILPILLFTFFRIHDKEKPFIFISNSNFKVQVLYPCCFEQ